MKLGEIEDKLKIILNGQYSAMVYLDNQFWIGYYSELGEFVPQTNGDTLTMCVEKHLRYRP